MTTPDLAVLEKLARMCDTEAEACRNGSAAAMHEENSWRYEDDAIAWQDGAAAIRAAIEHIRSDSRGAEWIKARQQTPSPLVWSKEFQATIDAAQHLAAERMRERCAQHLDAIATALGGARGGGGPSDHFRNVAARIRAIPLKDASDV